MRQDELVAVVQAQRGVVANMRAGKDCTVFVLNTAVCERPVEELCPCVEVELVSRSAVQEDADAAVDDALRIVADDRLPRQRSCESAINI